ncbi:hypothetical protein SCT_2071 [Sulfuricella sp. T08]|uniref:hypothetical protein n=1 Tax=Sulfuricella sp. T08 TaxID=1632857 RepID=UPI0006179BDC|nr:hypothetical protein [Sulfuricella sp. T08]GAO36661.1 hypothetical protein SCT_2071 [Sulfuricella sp. T08]
MPWYEVIVKASQQILVEAETPEEAATVAFDEAFGMEQCEKECDYPKATVGGTELESLKRHADLILPDGDDE